MASPSVPLSLLVTREVPYEWHDALAIAAQFVEQLRADITSPNKRIPDSSGVALEASGALTITLDPMQSLPAMPGTVQILQQLLGGKEQPTALRLALLKAVSDEPAPSLDAFAAELSRWERPNRQAKLAALYQRAVEHLGFAPAAGEIAPPGAAVPVLAKTAAVARTSAKRAPATRRQPAASLTRRELSVLGGSAVAVLGAAIWIATGQPIPFVAASPATTPQARVEPAADAAASTNLLSANQQPVAESQSPAAAAAVEPVPQTASAPAAAASLQPGDIALVPPAPESTRPVVDRATSPSPAPAPAATKPSAAVRPPSAAPVAPTPVARAPRAPAAADVASRRVAPTRPEPSAPPVPPRDARRSPTASNRVPSEQPTAITGSVTDRELSMPVDVGTSTLEYRSGDAGVIPPVPLARMPKTPEPGTPSRQLQVLEVHVNSDGTVETARFVDSAPSYRNRWWTSAAKSWRFRPALKDGRPVKYVLRIVIQDPGGA
jgi:hypothetical protein